MPQTPFSHIAVRFPTKVRKRLELLQNELRVRSLTAVVRLELEGRLPLWERGRPILSQSCSAPRSDLWLPKPLVDALRSEAAQADANLCDLVVTIVAEDEAQQTSRSTLKRAYA